MALPEFFVAGAPKSGTTALHAALAQHPGLYLSPVKEPKFFLTDGPPPAQGGPGDAKTYREHVWRRPDYEALFDAGAARRASWRVDPVLPVQPRRATTDQGTHPGRKADRRSCATRSSGPTRTGRISGRPASTRSATSSRLAPPRIGASARAGRISGNTSGSASTGSSCSTCTQSSRPSRCWSSGTGSSSTTRPGR